MSNTIDLTKLFPPDPISTINILDAYAPLNAEGWGTKCILPWTHLHVWPNHDVFPCCITNYKIGSTKNDTMKDIWNNDEMKNIRKQMLDGKKPKACTTCYKAEEYGNKSQRLTMNKELANEYHRIIDTKPDGRLEKMDLAYWDFRFSNVCNLKCRSCGPQLSTGWYNDAKEQNRLDRINRGDNPEEYKDGIIKGTLPVDLPDQSDKRLIKLWEELEPHFPSVQEIYFAGGEPLVMEEHYRILNRLIEMGRAHEVRLKYNTNFTNLQYKKTNVLDLWPKFERVEVGASLDAYGERAEYIRSGCDWNDIVTNRRQMQIKAPNANFYAACTVGITNAYHITEFHKHLIHEEIIDDMWDFRLNVIQTPQWLNISNLPRPMKNELTDMYNEHIAWLKEKHYKRNNHWETPAQEFAGIINFLNATPPDFQSLHSEDFKFNHWQGSFTYKMDQLDQIRNENWRKNFPEIYEKFKENNICL